MDLQSYIVVYILVVITLVILDLLWLGVFAKTLYQQALGHLLGKVRWIPAIIFYFVFVTGLFVFVGIPFLQAPYPQVAMYGALYGFFTYATYNLTNHATLNNWPLRITLIDIAWGTVLAGFLSLLTHVGLNYL